MLTKEQVDFIVDKAVGSDSAYDIKALADEIDRLNRLLAIREAALKAFAAKEAWCDCGESWKFDPYQDDPNFPDPFEYADRELARTE